MPTVEELEQAALTAASAITISDLVSFAEWFAKLVGGHDNAIDLVERARARAAQETIDLAEELRLQKIQNP